MKKFDELIIGMDIPINRVNDWAWLIRNLQIRNSKHPNFKEVNEIVKQEFKAWMNSKKD